MATQLDIRLAKVQEQTKMAFKNSLLQIIASNDNIQDVTNCLIDFLVKEIEDSKATVVGSSSEKLTIAANTIKSYARYTL